MCITYFGTLDNTFFYFLFSISIFYFSISISLLVVQIGTMKCFYCPQKDASLVPWDSVSRTDQNFLRDKYPVAGQGAVCDLCVRSARRSAFFS